MLLAKIFKAWITLFHTEIFYLNLNVSQDLDDL